MGYDLCVYNSYSIVRCLDLLFFDILIQKCCTVAVGLHSFKVDVVRSPCDVRTESLCILIQNARRSYGSTSVSVDFYSPGATGVPWTSD